MASKKVIMVFIGICLVILSLTIFIAKDDITLRRASNENNVNQSSINRNSNATNANTSHSASIKKSETNTLHEASNDNSGKSNIINKSELVGETVNPDTFILEDLSVYDTISKKYIYLGMTKKQIEDILEIEGITIGNQKAYYYQGLKIFYRDNKAAGLTISSYSKIDELSKRGKNSSEIYYSEGRYITTRNVGLGSKRNDIIHKYGACDINNVSNVIVYIVSKDGDLIKKLPSNRNEETNKYHQYYISFNLTKDNEEKVEYIQIGDYEFTFMLH